MMKKFLEFCLVACVSWYGITTGTPAFSAEPRIQRQHYINDRGEDVYHGSIQRRTNDNKFEVWYPSRLNVSNYNSLLEYINRINNQRQMYQMESSSWTEKQYNEHQRRALEYWSSVEEKRVAENKDGNWKNQSWNRQGNYIYNPEIGDYVIVDKSIDTVNYNPPKPSIPSGVHKEGYDSHNHSNPYNKYDKNGKRIRTGW